MAEEIKADVVVIGGGLSGLSAAYALRKKDPNLVIKVLEAKDRVGGRTLVENLKCANGIDTWDLGGQWVGSCQPHVMGLIEELGLEVYEQYHIGRKVMQLGDHVVRTYKADIPALSIIALIDLQLFIMKINRMWKMVPIKDPTQCPHATKWDNTTLAEFVRQNVWTEGARDAICAAGRCMHGAEPEDMSLLYFLSYCNAAGGFEPLIGTDENSGQQFKIKGGAAQLSTLLADELGKDSIYLNHPVATLEQGNEAVVVKTVPGKVFKCDRVIICTPPHQTAKLHITPPLPSEKQYVLNRMPVGCLIKFIVTYHKAFWRDMGYSGEVVSNGGPSVSDNCNTGPICIAYDATSPSGNPAIVGFIGGKQQHQYGKLSLTERRRAVIQSLADYFGSRALDFIDYGEKDWNTEPYSGGCPVSMASPGVMTLINPGLRIPVNRLHFGGTESATVWCGFLNGAIQSGIRAANEVLYNIKPHLVTVPELEDTAYGPRPDYQKMQPRLFSSHHVVRWTMGIGAVCIMVVAAKKAYFHILI